MLRSLFFVCALASQQLWAAGPFTPIPVEVQAIGLLQQDSLGTKSAHHVSRALTAALAVTLGPFGGHRLYLGTTPKVPLVYGLTFGGFGVLVVIDLAHILFTKDLSVYQDSDRIFMWAKPRVQDTTPP